jgi:hypothetical protein
MIKQQIMWMPSLRLCLMLYTLEAVRRNDNISRVFVSRAGLKQEYLREQLEREDLIHEQE